MSSRICLFLALAVASGCGGSSGSSSSGGSSSPTTPSGPVQLAVFMDPASSFSTSDVRDVQDQIVRFDTTTGSMIWVADGRTFVGFPVSGNFIRADKAFQVRFGTKQGERRAYFTEASSGTICDIEVVNGALLITGTTVPVPGGS
jgi:hypothetical protein